MMRRISTGTLLLAAVLLTRPVWAADRAEDVKTGGNYEVEIHKDVPYVEGKEGNELQKLDLYLPKGVRNYPTLFFVHGGGWRRGSRTRFGPIGRTFARNGVAFVATDYRLSPEVKHPGHIEDVARSFAWTVAHIRKYGGNPEAIFVSGHSAGGHLTALLATDEDYLKAHKLSLRNIKGAIPISGVFVATQRLKDIFGDDKEVYKKASPRSHVRAGLPPFLILYADNDLGNLGRQAEAFGAALKEQKVEATIVKGADRDHGTIMRKMVAQDDPATQSVLEFIARHSDLKLTAKKAR